MKNYEGFCFFVNVSSRAGHNIILLNSAKLKIMAINKPKFWLGTNVVKINMLYATIKIVVVKNNAGIVDDITFVTVNVSSWPSCRFFLLIGHKVNRIINRNT